MFNFIAITDIEIFQKSKTTVIPSIVESKVEAIWQKAKIKSKKPLYNGRVLSVDNIHMNKINTSCIEYKYFFSQQTDSSLFNVLKIRPLAVSGILECPDGFVFGLRHATNQDNKVWELAPSGSIDFTTNNSKKPHIYQILTELEEEIGLNERDLTKINPFAIIDDQVTHVVDIGIYLKTNLPFADIFNVYKQNGCNEYSDILVIPIHNITNFIENNPVVSVSKILIQHVIDY